MTLKPSSIAHFLADLDLPAGNGIVDQTITVVVGIDDRRRHVPFALFRLRNERCRKKYDKDS
jgi:hypothetical protein